MSIETSQPRLRAGAPPPRSWAAACILLSALLACSEAGDGPPDAPDDTGRPLVIYAVNHPLAYFAERIGGRHVEVFLPAPPDVDPAFWSPAPETVAAYQSADLLLENGAGYAAWLRHATLPRGIRVDTSAGFADRLIDARDAVTHAHGPEGAHSHAGTAFTTWLDPRLALEQARAIAEAMIERRPAAEPDLRTGLAALERDLRDLDERLERATAPLAGRPVLFSHPVYPYLARRYGLDGRSLHLEPGERADAAQWRAVEQMLAERPASWMLFEGAPHPELEARLLEAGVRVVVFEPGGSRPASGDWLSLMRANAERLAAFGAALGEEG